MTEPEPDALPQTPLWPFATDVHNEMISEPIARGSSSMFHRKLRLPDCDLSRSRGALDTLIEMLQVQVLRSYR
jgi:hypothetical protein